MIKLVGDGDIEEFLAFCGDDPIGIRMSAALLSYGTDFPFADFWLVKNGRESVGALSKLDSDASVLAGDCFYEIADFLPAVGASSITGYEDTVKKLGFSDGTKRGHIMLYNGYAEIKRTENFKTDLNPSVMEFCRLLCECESDSIKIGDFDRFYTDLSHRVRHNTAVCAVGYCDGQAVATAAAGALTGGGAVISAVSVLPEYRRCGFGSAVVCDLLTELLKIDKNKKICLYRADGENGEFYGKLGFTDFARWATFRGKRD